MKKYWIITGWIIVLSLTILVVVVVGSSPSTADQVIEVNINPSSEFKIINSNIIQVQLVEFELEDIQTGSITLRVWSNTPWQLKVSAEPLSSEGKDPQVIPQENFTYTSSFEAPGKNIKVVDNPLQFSTIPTVVAEGLDPTTGNEGVEISIIYTINVPLSQKPGQYSTLLYFTLNNKIP